jgi:GMP synthase (glutamine-hydrolysing)
VIFISYTLKNSKIKFNVFLLFFVELNVYCEMHSCLVNPEILRSSNLVGIILSGGPASVYEKDAPHVHPEIWELAKQRSLPILGICYGMQELMHTFGGSVKQAPEREFGHAEITKVGSNESMVDLFHSLPENFNVWMSHGDKVVSIPSTFSVFGTTSSCEFAAVKGHLPEAPNVPVYGIQFHPEVSHTPLGQDMLKNFVLEICKATPNWSMESFLDESIQRIREMVGPEGKVIGAVSGGVDSTVAAVLLNRAIGSRFYAVMVDNGVLRKNESQEVCKRLRDECGVNLQVVDASKLFLDKLAGVSDPEKKRKIIGNTFIEVFEEEASKLGKVDFLLQGTLYPDVIESISYKGPSATIKSHHNVGGLLENMKLKLIEPLRELFKDEVRSLGRQLGLPEDSINRHPFPGPGLAIRILGDITPESCDLLREADDIFLQELRSSGEYAKSGQAFAVLLPCKSVGVMGDCRTYEKVLAIRAVTTTDYMTADWSRLPYDLLAKVSSRIINEVRGINRVVYDITSKPPGTIEWE